MGPSTTILPATGRTRRDGARRALHSQIERRRREKINDRLIALRNTVPSCALLMAHRLNHQVPLAGPLAARYANAPPPKLSNDDEVETGQTTSRSRRRGPPPPPPNYDEELGLHKLDVLSATVDYITELHAYIDTLLAERPTASASLTTSNPRDEPVLQTDPATKEDGMRRNSSSATDETVSESSPLLARAAPEPRAEPLPKPVAQPRSPLTPTGLTDSRTVVANERAVSSSSFDSHIKIRDSSFSSRWPAKDSSPNHTSLRHYSLSSSANSSFVNCRSSAQTLVSPGRAAAERKASDAFGLRTPAWGDGFAVPPSGSLPSAVLDASSSSSILSPPSGAFGLSGSKDSFLLPSPMSLPLSAASLNSGLPPLSLPPASMSATVPCSHDSGPKVHRTRAPSSATRPESLAKRSDSTVEDDAHLLLYLHTSPPNAFGPYSNMATPRALVPLRRPALDMPTTQEPQKRPRPNSGS